MISIYQVTVALSSNVDFCNIFTRHIFSYNVSVLRIKQSKQITNENQVSLHNRNILHPVDSSIPSKKIVSIAVLILKSSFAQLQLSSKHTYACVITK